MRKRSDKSVAGIRIEDGTLFIDGILDFDTVTTLEKTGTTWLSGPAPTTCVLDLSGVGYCNSAGVALLLAWMRVARKRDKMLVLRHLPEEFLSMIRLAGLEDYFGIEGQGDRPAAAGTECGRSRRH